MEFAVVYRGSQYKANGTYVSSYVRVECGLGEVRLGPANSTRDFIDIGHLDPKRGQSLQEIWGRVFVNPHASIQVKPAHGPHLWFRQTYDALTWLDQHGYIPVEHYIKELVERTGSDECWGWSRGR